MKINVKTKTPKTVQRNLRVPVALNQQMDDISKLADELGADYHGTLLGIIEQFNSEFGAKLREMKAKGESYTNSGINAGSESIPAPVSLQAKQPSASITKSTPVNGAEPERA
jgi:hypothetical protein